LARKKSARVSNTPQKKWTCRSSLKMSMIFFNIESFQLLAWAMAF
jgi:hypothetical protein